VRCRRLGSATAAVGGAAGIEPRVEDSSSPRGMVAAAGRSGLRRGMEAVARRIGTAAWRREVVTDERGVGETSFHREI
jgi:hypothetical protein